jgi:hypothetical protein
LEARHGFARPSGSVSTSAIRVLAGLSINRKEENMLLFDPARALKARESRVRRALAKDGYCLTKCRRGYGGYGVVDCASNFMVLGLSGDGRGYDARLEDVEEWMES